jgi:NMD protein affecting ribosome stability and mRNA decay
LLLREKIYLKKIERLLSILVYERNRTCPNCSKLNIDRLSQKS